MISDRLRDFLVQEEGMRLHVYLDSGGAPTIGIGHCLTLSERRSGKLRVGVSGDVISYRNGLTEQECFDLLDQDLAPIAAIVDSTVPTTLEDYQRDALISFTFNVGATAFLHSTLLRLLLRGDYAGVPTQLMRWVHDNGHVVPGLVNRRRAECALWDNTWAKKD
jgi:lysozyme